MREISTIRLELSDWLYNAGIVGLANILDDSNYAVEKNYLEFDSAVLENFEEKYFKYFIRKYMHFTSWYKIIRYKDKLFKILNGEYNDEDIESLNNQIDFVKRQLSSSSYQSGYLVIPDKELDLLDESKKISKIQLSKKKKDNFENIVLEQGQRLLKIIEFMEKPSVSRILLAKNIIYNFICCFWENVSFLDKNKSKLCMYEAFSEYFIEPVSNFFSSINAKESKNKCFACNRNIITGSKAYDLTWIVKTGVDASRKSSHFWNYSSDVTVCPICNLVYSCVPAGFTIINKRGFFINNNSNVMRLININKQSLENIASIDEIEHQSYYQVVETMSYGQADISKVEMENIQFVKLDGENNRRPYTFNILSKGMIEIISKNKNMLKSLLRPRRLDKDEYINLYSEVIKRLYSNQNLFQLINMLLRVSIARDINLLNEIDILVKINNVFLGGLMKEKAISNEKINVIRKFGKELRDAYKKSDGENKIGGISYRMVNALKTKNSRGFMDTLINSYMYLNKEIPGLFVDILKDEELFQTIGYAFLLGLQGDEYKKNQNNTEGVVENEN
ncbi:MAG: type I-B CRISPR-associated protein Cas8b1/Cst1 [Clostridiaceae bacterium]|nr:type I-B CRISPR-associated protein Cas8b1/Cst1 [Clostridiaceae bacterium]